MDKMTYPMDAIELRVLDPMEIVAEWLVNPEIIFGLETFRTAAMGGDHDDIGCLLDSLWARDTEKTVHAKDQNGVMITLIFYEDKVSIGGGSPHSFNAAVMTSANFSLKQTNTDISKAMLGYIPSLRNVSEITSHLRSVLNWTQKQAEDEVKIFNMKIARKFWEIVLTSVQHCWDQGAELYHKGAIITVYPCIPFAKGDEVALKSQSEILQGNCYHSCLNFNFDSLNGM
jgi:hypothetical protein